MIDPKLVAKSLLEEAARSGNPINVNSAPVSAPRPVVQTMEGYAVTAPVPLIPLPEGVSMPQSYVRTTPPPLPNQQPPPLPAQAQVAPPLPSAQPTDRQMEFAFTIKTQKFNNSIEYFEERYNRIEAKFDIINNKLNEILANTRRKPYERKNKPVADKLD
jgi:hypothetical protein